MELVIRLTALAYLLLAAAAQPSSTSTYPTTATRSYTRTTTSKPPRRTGAAPDTDTPDAIPTSAAVLKVTLADAWPSSPNPESFPYTLSQTAVTFRADVLIHGGSTTTLASSTLSATTTWVIWDTSATDLPKGRALPRCSRCASRSTWQDPRCADRGFETACHSQCLIRPVEGVDVWWCQKREPGAEAAEVRIGRVCSGGDKHYEQLLEPCHSDDHRHDCPACAERDEL